MNENDEIKEHLIDTSKEINEKEQNNIIFGQNSNKIKEKKDIGVRRMTSFEIELMNAVKKEEEAQQRKKILKVKNKIIKQLNLFYTKDYLFLFILLMSSSVNFSYLYLINIVIAVIYIFFIESLSKKAKKIKYLCEIFSIGYSSYLLIFKLISLILIHNENELIKNHANLFIDLGICHLIDYDKYKEGNNKDSIYYFFFVMTFLPEIFVIIISGYSIFISFICRILEEEDSKFKEIKKLTMRKIILLSYIFIVLYSLFNISFLSLLYIIFIQFILLLNSVRMTNKSLKSFYHFIIYFLIISLFAEIILTNIFNIPTLKNNILNVNKIELDEDIKYYSFFTQIGIKYIYNNTGKNICLNFLSYLFGVILLLTLYYIHIELKSGLNIISEEEMEKIKSEMEKKIIENDYNNIDNDNISNKENGNNIINNKDNKDKNEIDKKPKKKSVIFSINLIYKLFSFMMNHPNLNYEIERIISIIWTYYYRNYYSLVMYLVLFCSFFFVDRIKIKYLILFILTPILLMTIGSFHISNIDGILEKISDDDKLFFSKFAMCKYKYLYFEHITGHIYFLSVNFLIYTYYSKKIEKKNENDLILENNKLLENNIQKNDVKKKGEENNEIQDEDLYENKSENQSDEDSDDDLTEEEKKESKKIKFAESINKEIKSFDISKLLIKFFFYHIDKTTLVIMYFVSVYTVNLTHVFLVFIFVLQIVIPKQIRYLYKILIIIFQIVYLFEFIIDLLKIYYYETFKDHSEFLNLFIIYNDDLNKCDIEIFLYAILYCLYFQNTTRNLEFIKIISKDKSITYENYINNKFVNLPTIKSIFLFIAKIINHIILWCLVFLFIFFTCYYEINLIFGVKLLFFFISLYIFILIIHKKTMSARFRFIISNQKCYIIFNRIFLILCSLNTFSAFLYQFICKDYFKISSYIQDEENDNFFIKNLPNIGFTLYKDNLYYHFIPHFLTSLISTLYVYKSEEILSNLDKTLSKSLKR